MLTSLRKQTGSIFIKGLLILLIVSFGAWGIQDWLSPAISGNFVASVGNQDISPNQLQRRVQSRISSVRSVLGNQFTMEQARQFGLIDAAMNELVSRALLVEGANAMGVAISDDIISSDIRGSDSFKGLAGAFDRDAFNRTLANSGLTEAGYIAELRRDLGVAHFADSLTAGVTTPKVLASALYAYRNETRTAEVMLVENASFSDVANPDQTTLAAFHTEKAAQFTAPEYRKVTYVSLDADTLAKDIEVSEDDIAEGYEARLGDYTTTEKRRVFQMILSTEDKVAEAKKQLGEGRDFATVAKEVAGHDEGTVDLGVISKDDMLPELADAAFAVAESIVTEPVKSAFGWHFFKSTEVQPGGVKALDEVHDEVKHVLAKEKAIDSMYDLSNRLEDSLGGGSTLEEAAQSIGLTASTLDAIDGRGSDIKGTPVTGLPAGGAFVQTAFATEEGEESGLTEAGPDGFFIVRVDSVTAPAVRPLDSIRSDVIAAWKADQKEIKAKEIAEKVVEKLNSGTEFQVVADEMDLAFKLSKPFSRTDRGQVSEIEGDLVTKVFDLERGKAALHRSSEGYQIARLKDVIAVTSGANAELSKTLTDELSTQMVGDVISQLAVSLRGEHGVDVNQPMVDYLFSADRNEHSSM
jgi:peptidyl-prolyl cis-trans isomerase D